MDKFFFQQELFQKNIFFNNLNGFVLGNILKKENEIVVGISLMEKLKATITDSMRLISMYSLKNAIHTLQIPTGIEVLTSGIIQTDNVNYDLLYCYANYNLVRKICGNSFVQNFSEDAISYLDIFLFDNEKNNIIYLSKIINNFLPEELEPIT